ncbi:MAG: hypothetical protein LBF40_08880 [Deltaproteobacteria bacterium]|jgi:hypothetical protein|nr:hypothetical protein [Deltaproteobacteria bacterium]
MPDRNQKRTKGLTAELALNEGMPEGIDSLEPGESAFAEGRLQLPSEAMVRHEAMIINEVSLILAEKRTALSVLRTGLAVLVLPTSVLSVLIAISRYYDPLRVMYLLAPLLGLCFVLGVFGVYLIVRSWRKAYSLDLISVHLVRQNAHLDSLLGLARQGREKG